MGVRRNQLSARICVIMIPYSEFFSRVGLVFQEISWPAALGTQFLVESTSFTGADEGTLFEFILSNCCIQVYSKPRSRGPTRNRLRAQRKLVSQHSLNQSIYAPNADAHADTTYQFNGYCTAESVHLCMHPAPMAAVAYIRRAAEIDTPFKSHRA